MQLSRATAFAVSLIAVFLAPAIIPGVGIFDIYFFIIVLVLLAWFSIKWKAVRELKTKGSVLEVALGVAAVMGLYAYKIHGQTTFGILDDTILFGAIALAFYGLRSFKLFWVPTVYGVVLLFGYQVEGLIPNYLAMQDWLAGIMASAMNLMGIASTVSGHLVTLSSSGGPLALDVQGDCTGLQGILAFGLLSTMSVLDIKPRMSRLVPIFIIGFLGAFLINIVRLFLVFVTFEYLGVAAGTTVHVYAGYALFIVWVLAFWSIAFRYLGPPVNRSRPVVSNVPPPAMGGAA